VNFTTSKHGRSARDCRNLVRHLNKLENDFSKVLEIGNSAAVDLEGVIEDMVILKDGSVAIAALHHVTVNPAVVCTEEALLKAAHAARLELDPDGARPFIILCHGKARQAPNAANAHAHLVLGNVNAEGRCSSADNLRLVRRFAKGGSGSSGLEFKRPAADAASVG
jgi:hypothetical protein